LVGLSTWSRASGMGPAEWIGAALDLGVRAVALDATADEAWAGELLEELRRRREELALVAVEAPEVPRLASSDREERRAAGDGILQHARALGSAGGAVVIRMGALDGRHGWEATVRAYQRRGRGRLAQAARQAAWRAQQAGQAVERARLGLGPVLDRLAAGEAEGPVVLAVVNRPRWFELPDAIELATLLDEFRGAPVAPWFDPAAAHARAVLGFDPMPAEGAPATDWLALHKERLAGAWLTDAAGLRGGLPWGRGEVDREIIRQLPAGAPRIVHCTSGATRDELATALI
jgi:hypothetical protein